MADPELQAINDAADAEARERQRLLSHGGELIRAEDLRVGDRLLMMAGRGADEIVTWWSVTEVDPKPQTVWLTVRHPEGWRKGWRPRRSDELVAKRG